LATFITSGRDHLFVGDQRSRAVAKASVEKRLVVPAGFVESQKTGKIEAFKLRLHSTPRRLRLVVLVMSSPSPGLLISPGLALA
jgi:hypothetical protein